MKTWHFTLVPLALAGMLACGGSGAAQGPSSQTAAQLDSESALALSTPFITTEANQAGEFDGSGPFQAGEALAVAAPHAPGCVTVSVNSSTSVTWTYVNCTGPHGWTWNGVVVITWQRNSDGTVLVKHDHQNMVGAKDGKTWTVNGIRDALCDPTTKIATITVEPGFTKAFNNGTTTDTYAYSASLTADYSTAGQRKLYGTWSLAETGSDTITGTIAQGAPLIWDKTSGCCYPISGTLALTKGSKSATMVYGLPCGSVTINGTAKTLPACAY